MATRRAIGVTSVVICLSVISVVESAVCGQGLQVKEDDLFAVSPLIGDTLDVEEKEFYQFLPQYDGFKWATFHRTPTDTLAVTVCFEFDGSTRLRHFPRYLPLESIVEHIHDVIHEKLEEDAEHNRGALVEVVQRDSQRVIGEILSLRDSAIVVGSEENRFDHIQLIPAGDIEEVVLEGESHLGLGVVTGIAAGSIVGGVVTASREEDNKTASSAPAIAPGVWYFAGGLAGAAGGLLIAAIVDEVAFGDSVVVIHQGNVSALKTFARYLDKEPLFLKSIK